MTDKIFEIVKSLERNPDEAHWKVFHKDVLKSKARYYKVFYPKKLKKLSDLYSAYVIVYDAKYVPMFRIPAFMKAGRKIQGATIYLEGLLNTNKDYKEWIA